MLDLKLTQLGLRNKNLVVVDLSFPQTVFPEFKKVYDARLIWMPCRKELALLFAAGLASFGKVVLVYGLDQVTVDGIDRTANVKLLRHDAEGSWRALEEGLQRFGPEALLIPE